MLICLTNAQCGQEGTPLAVNATYIEAIFVTFTGEVENCRIAMRSGELFIVRDTFHEVMAALTPSPTIEGKE